MSDDLAKAMLVAHARYRVDMGINMPECERERTWPSMTIAEIESGTCPLEHIWSHMPWQERDAFAYYARAVLDFLRFPEGVEPTKGCVGEAIRKLHAALNSREKQVQWIRVGEALRALGEEVERG